MAHERIIRAAIRVGQDVYHMPPPMRHHNILHGYRLGPEAHDQGFLTDQGRYVSRREAVKIALEAGQITLPKRTHPQDRLFSEDLW